MTTTSSNQPETVKINGIIYTVIQRCTPESEKTAGHLNVARILDSDNAHLLFLKRGNGKVIYEAKEFHHSLGNYYGKVINAC